MQKSEFRGPRPEGETFLRLEANIGHGCTAEWSNGGDCWMNVVANEKTTSSHTGCRSRPCKVSVGLQVLQDRRESLWRYTKAYKEGRCCTYPSCKVATAMILEGRQGA